MKTHRTMLPALLLAAAACAPPPPASEPGAHVHTEEVSPARTATIGEAPDITLPASVADATARLAASPRHAEWAMVDAGGRDSVRVWLVYPERADRAPVVLVVHEIFGLTHWIRGVADQLAADGFIAVAPDLLTGAGVPEDESDPDPEAARTAIRTLAPADVQRRLAAAARWATALPAALPAHGIIGFCWGGTVAFEHAASGAGAGASVVFYGTSPSEELLRRVATPVLGLYGENDARVNATIAPAEATLLSLGRTFAHTIYPGAGHGFLRAQDGQDGANLAATRAAWPRTLHWLRTHLEPN
jgi:carboxymethylenebutenolidase